MVKCFCHGRMWENVLVLSTFPFFVTNRNEGEGGGLSDGGCCSVVKVVHHHRFAVVVIFVVGHVVVVGDWGPRCRPCRPGVGAAEAAERQSRVR